MCIFLMMFPFGSVPDESSLNYHPSLPPQMSYYQRPGHVSENFPISPLLFKFVVKIYQLCFFTMLKFMSTFVVLVFFYYIFRLPIYSLNHFFFFFDVILEAVTLNVS